MTTPGHDPSSATRALTDPASGSRTRIADVSAPPAWLSAEELAIDLDDPRQRRFGDYELVARIGEGGMGVVYRARQHGLERDVALKLLAAGPWASEEFIARFRREARSAARMQHPNIVEIYEFGERDGLNYFSMRLIDGESLEQRLRREGAMAPADAARLLRRIAEAIDYAHRLGVLHLDLKPANVLLTSDGEPLVADFGLARRIDAGHEGNGEISGTPSYMAPEQAQLDTHPLSASTDIYGLGATLYRMITGKPPFKAADAQTTLERVVASPPPRPAAIRDGIPADLEAICLKCLEKVPANRYASARDLADDLARFCEGRPVTVRPLSAPQRLLRWARREPRVAIAATAAFAALAVGFGVATVQWREADAARRIAEARAERNSQLAALMAQVFPTDPPATDAEGRPVDPGSVVVGWLEANLPGRDGDQADILVSFVDALDAADKYVAARDLLLPVTIALGRDYRRRVADAYVARGGGRDLAIAAMLLQQDGDMPAGDGARQLDLLRRAVALEPRNLDVLVIAARFCPMPACADFDPRRRLAELEPDNGMNWVLAAARHRHSDPAAVRELLHRAGQASRYDDHYRRLQAINAETVEHSGVEVPEALLRTATRLAGNASPEAIIGLIQTYMMPVPPLNGFADICNPRKNELDAALRADCLHFARQAANQDGGLVSMMVGGTMIRRLVPGSAEAQEMRELRRQWLYTMAIRRTMTAAQARAAQDELQPAENIVYGELEAIKRTLDRAGLPRDPPPDWQPEDPGHLMLPEEAEAWRAANADAGS